MSFTITAIIPVLNRPKNVKPFIESFIKNTPNDKAELLFVTDSTCQEEIDEIKKFEGLITVAVAPPATLSWAKRINWGADYSAANHLLEQVSPWILCAADDVIFHPNWFEAAEAACLNFDGILGTNDLGHIGTITGSHTTHPIVSRKYISEQGTLDEVGKLCHEGYIHNYVDAEFVHTAHKRGCWKHASNCIIEHNHPAWQKNDWDDIYQKGLNGLDADRALWIKRKAQFKL